MGRWHSCHGFFQLEKKETMYYKGYSVKKKKEKRYLHVMENIAKYYVKLSNNFYTTEPGHLFLNPTKELEHGDVGWRLGHAQG